MSPLKMLTSCCGVQEFYGIGGGSGKDVLLGYCKANWADNKPNPHTFVLFTFTNSKPWGENVIKGEARLKEFRNLIKKEKLGITTATDFTENLRYKKTGGTPIQCTIYQPDFEALEVWYKAEIKPKKVMDKIKSLVK